MISSLSLLISIPTFHILLHWIFRLFIYLSMLVCLVSKKKSFKTRQMEAQKSYDLWVWIELVHIRKKTSLILLHLFHLKLTDYSVAMRNSHTQKKTIARSISHICWSHKKPFCCPSFYCTLWISQSIETCSSSTYFYCIYQSVFLKIVA